MASIGPRGNQGGDKDRPYWVWIWQGNLGGGGAFGASEGWTRFDAGQKGREVDFGSQSLITRCVKNCSPRRRRGNIPINDPPPEYEIVNTTPENPIPNNDGREPSVAAFIPTGLPGQTGAIPAFFPPIKVDVDCQQSPLRIEGGQIFTIYDLTIRAEGFIREEVTNRLLVPFSVSTTTRGPGPIIGYTVSQYTFGTGSKDLRAVVYYTDEENNIGDFVKNFQLSLSNIVGEEFTNMTLEGNQYYFDIETVELDNLTRADGINDTCGTSTCDVEYEVNYHTGDPQNVTTDSFTAIGLPFIVYRLTLSGLPGDASRQVLAHNAEDTIIQPIRQATASEFYISAPITNITCSYDVNGQIPGCFIETPETCQVTISDRSGVLFQQTYFGRPQIETSTQYIETNDQYL